MVMCISDAKSAMHWRNFFDRIAFPDIVPVSNHPDRLRTPRFSPDWRRSLPLKEVLLLTSVSITQLLADWSGGDESALEQLTPYVYAELRRLAAHYLRKERPDHTLQATALVHEAYLQILDMQHVEWRNRAHFIGIAAQMMRRILITHARKHDAAKRGAGAFKVSLSSAEREAAENDVNLVALDGALESLAKDYPRHAQVVELRFFGGLNSQETANVQKAGGVETSTRTVERDWRFARAWLLNEIDRTASGY